VQVSLRQTSHVGPFGLAVLRRRAAATGCIILDQWDG
jgi:hypothetical protein